MYKLDPFWKEILEFLNVCRKVERRNMRKRYKRYKTNTELPEEKIERCINIFILTEGARLIRGQNKQNK